MVNLDGIFFYYVVEGCVRGSVIEPFVGVR